MPDFDIDFCQEKRDEVIRYVRERFGSRQVAHIITFGTLQARAVLRDVGRVMGLPYGQVDRLCKFVPYDPARPVRLAEAIEREPALQDAKRNDPQIARLFDISLKLEGLYRHASTHAAGVVISDRPLDERIPMCRDPRSGALLTQFSMKWVEMAGLVKFDFLGLKTLTVLRIARDLLGARGAGVSLEQIPLDDPKTFALLGSGETTGVFQMESGGVRDALRRMQPDRFEDLIALVALYRPGPMDNIPRYIACKKGEETPDYLHPSLEEALRETFGVIIYQEQVMQIAEILSGYSAGEADLLRRAMGKKIRREMQEQQNRFVRGAVDRGVPQIKATEIFELVARFAGYGFNKSHAAAYALLAWRTAWLKTHHPTEFLAALMTLEIHAPERLGQIEREARRLNVQVVPPDINRSRDVFAVDGEEIVYALAALRNVGRAAAASLAEAREAGGPFRDLSDFARRIPAGQINKRALESLAQAGAFDALEANRRRVCEGAEQIMRFAAGAQEARAQGQNSLFEGGGGGEPGLVLPDCAPWSRIEALGKELEAAGFYLSGHPLENMRAELEESGFFDWKSLCASPRLSGRLAGVVTALHERRSRRGSRFAFLSLSDLSGSYEVVVFSDLLRQSRTILEAGRLIGLEVEIDRSGETGAEAEVKLRAQELMPLENMLARRRRKPVPRAASGGFAVFLEEIAALEAVKQALAARPGGGKVRLIVPAQNGGGEVEIQLPGAFALSREAQDALKALPGVRRVEAA